MSEEPSPRRPLKTAELTAGLRFLLRVRVWLVETVRPSEMQVTLVRAGFAGLFGALISIAFRKAAAALHWLLTGQNSGYVETFTHLLPWQRLVVPAVGGALAGLALLIGKRLGGRQEGADYMEAVVLGDGQVPVRHSLAKSVSGMFSIATGASIGREGPMVQLSAMLASALGRVLKVPTLQLRLLVACGAAAGIASAYNAPIGGALFVAEIVLRSTAMDTFGPLVLASVVATLTTRQILGTAPLYHIPPVALHSNWEMILHLGLGLFAGLLAPWFLRLLRVSERFFARVPGPAIVRLALGGLIVGALAVIHPEVCGNGYSVVSAILQGAWAWQALALLLLLKLLATSSSFGSGAAGGVFTPTLFVGACLGQCLAQVVTPFWPGLPPEAVALTLVGMGAFLAATTHAPLMAILLLFEMSLDYQIILPLMLACVVAHYTSRRFEKGSIYRVALQRKGAGQFGRRLGELTVAHLTKPEPVCVVETARFAELAAQFVKNRFNYLYVVSANHEFRGAVSLHEIKPYLNDPDIADLIIARDLMRDDFPRIGSRKTLAEALQAFAGHDGERLPVVEEPAQKLIGSLSRTDLLLAFVEYAKVDPD